VDDREVEVRGVEPACDSATVTEDGGELAEVVVGWAQEAPPRPWAASIFLAGPTPRDNAVASWRPAAVDALRRRWRTEGRGRLVVFVPELRHGRRLDAGDWDAQIAWEDECLNASDVIAFWVPRDMARLPGLTTNVEWGRWESSGKVVLGAPTTAPSTRYLRHYARRYGVTTADTLDATIVAALDLLRQRRPQPPPFLARSRPATNASERDTLHGLLDFLRQTVVAKVAGLTERQAFGRPVPPSILSPANLVKHLTGVERFWFAIDFAGQDLPWPWRDGDPDAGFVLDPGDTLASLVADYQAECARSREVIAAADLDDVARGPDLTFTLRYALAHMIEETGRHCGHLDLLRERIDGATGE
jgi:uncharacterized protein DUF664/nucleoside 2-deoxyribosyltransferase-like protein